MTKTPKEVLPKLDSASKRMISRIVGKGCCFQGVGEYRSLHVGFGDQILTVGPRGPRYRSEWEFGTYNAAWRILRHEELVCGNMDPVESNLELNEKVEKIRFGSFLEIQVVSALDIRLKTDNGVTVEFLCASSDDDEFFHILGIDKSFLSYSYPHGWQHRQPVHS